MVVPARIKIPSTNPQREPMPQVGGAYHDLDHAHRGVTQIETVHSKASEENPEQPGGQL